jgi:hypothetical protein
MEWRYPPGICKNLDDYILRKLIMPKEKGPDLSCDKGSVRVAGRKDHILKKETRLRHIQ